MSKVRFFILSLVLPRLHNQFVRSLQLLVNGRIGEYLCLLEATFLYSSGLRSQLPLGIVHCTKSTVDTERAVYAKHCECYASQAARI
ncbi:hypothetical protein GYMLUDRAFT_797670 [Collybiopsis luxurians FD-317 M1]|nr:hypothetical protein GYMLUDRAFT_797670 [Collybiopsis luxurians FD-317 M1]